MRFTRRRRFSPPLPLLKWEADKALYSAEILVAWFDKKLTFREHAKWTAAKAGGLVASISWHMSNLGEAE